MMEFYTILLFAAILPVFAGEVANAPLPAVSSFLILKEAAIHAQFEQGRHMGAKPATQGMSFVRLRDLFNQGAMPALSDFRADRLARGAAIDIAGGDEPFPVRLLVVEIGDYSGQKKYATGYSGEDLPGNVQNFKDLIARGLYAPLLEDPTQRAVVVRFHASDIACGSIDRYRKVELEGKNLIVEERQKDDRRERCNRRWPYHGDIYGRSYYDLP